MLEAMNRFGDTCQLLAKELDRMHSEMHQFFFGGSARWMRRQLARSNTRGRRGARRVSVQCLARVRAGALPMEGRR